MNVRYDVFTMCVYIEANPSTKMAASGELSLTKDSMGNDKFKTLNL